jgi:tetrahydrodipicolinate N-succinyltransferase
LAQFPIVYYLAQRSEKKERDFVNLHINQFYTQYRSILNSYKLLSQQVYDDSINKEKVLNIAKNAYLSKNKEKLSQMLKPIYIKLKKRGFSTLEFYLKSDTPIVSSKDYKQKNSSKKISKRYSTKIKINQIERKFVM